MLTTAVVVHAPGQEFSFEEVHLDEPRSDEVLVRIVATGLCHTDLSLRDSLPAEMFPRVFGHEGTGVVEQIGEDVTGISVGDHVVLSFRSCRACGPCNEGAVGYCDNSLMLNYMGGPGDSLVVFGCGASYAIDLLQSGKIIRSSVEGDSDPLEMIPRLIEMRAAGDFDVDHLVKTYPHTQITQAIDDVLAGRVVKPVLVW